MMALLTSPEAWAALLTLTALEIVLGIDNVIFLSVVVSGIPPEQAKRARQIGLALALVFRILLLSLLVWLIGLTRAVLTVHDLAFSWRDIILIAGGLFLIAKATHEIHREVEAGHDAPVAESGRGAFFRVIFEITIIDIVFSLDSVFTAVGLANRIEVMVTAIVASVLVMMVVSPTVSRFIDRFPTIKVLALAFLVLVGVALIGESLDWEIPKAYLYFAMAFSAAVEWLNLRLRRRSESGA